MSGLLSCDGSARSVVVAGRTDGERSRRRPADAVVLPAVLNTHPRAEKTMTDQLTSEGGACAGDCGPSGIRRRHQRWRTGRALPGPAVAAAAVGPQRARHRAHTPSHVGGRSQGGRSARGDVATYFSEVLALGHHMETPQIRTWACASSRLALCRRHRSHSVPSRVPEPRPGETASVVRRGALAAPLQLYQAATGCTHSAGHHSINLR